MEPAPTSTEPTPNPVSARNDELGTELAEQQAKLAQLEELVRTSRAAFEECLADTLRTAEEFSKASRNRQRELAQQ